MVWRPYGVSIHAPTRGATPTGGIRVIVAIRFNPRTHTGCDPAATYNSGNTTMFQSTHPHGVRPPISKARPKKSEFQSTHPHGVRLHSLLQRESYQDCFNPRTHTGCDDSASTAVHAAIVSIHAPTRGATGSSGTLCGSGGFNPRTHTGCDGTQLTLLV